MVLRPLRKSVSKYRAKNWRGTQLTALEVLGDQRTNKRAHAIAWASTHYLVLFLKFLGF